MAWFHFYWCNLHSSVIAFPCVLSLFCINCIATGTIPVWCLFLLLREVITSSHVKLDRISYSSAVPPCLELMNSFCFVHVKSKDNIPNCVPGSINSTKYNIIKG
uniref:Uncharacterized protein n=1 Tax=Leersia perrieri TaxID=77586 RepID=A0A0D9X4Y9_9ORYZ